MVRPETFVPAGHAVATSVVALLRSFAISGSCWDGAGFIGCVSSLLRKAYAQYGNSFARNDVGWLVGSSTI